MTEKEFARLASSELPRLQGDSRGTTFTHEQLQRTFAKADLNGDGEIDFNEFFLGCCAADPSTVHILNSFTGYEHLGGYMRDGKK